jgi:hypothetical protein
MQKRYIIIFFLGLLIGGALMGALWVGSAIAQGMQQWGAAEVCFDADARQRLAESKLLPSATARDIFYYIDGFQDHRVFIAYTDTDESLNAIVRAMTGKPVQDLEPWSKQLDDWQMEPGTTDAKFPQSLYSPAAIKKGRFFASPPGASGWHLIIDEDAHRMYFGSWDT